MASDTIKPEPFDEPPPEEAPSQQPQQEDPPTDPDDGQKSSKLYSALSTLFFFFLLGVFGVLSLITAFTFDFLDIYTFRYKIPESLRSKWPLSSYFEFVKLHQLPEEERYQALLQQSKERYQQLSEDKEKDLQRRTESLEKSYRELVRDQEEQFRKQRQELLVMQEDIAKEKAKLEALKKEEGGKKESVKLLAQQIASQAIAIQGGLIRFMEDESRLKGIQEMSGAMDPKAMANIFNEVTDNRLISQILKGVPPDKSALILANMDPEKSGQIIKMSQTPGPLPTASSPRPYLPPALQELIASAQQLARE